jgi:hypothetical protein
MKHQILVGNIGTVIDTDSEDEALKAFAEYYLQSIQEHGRAGGESITWFVDNEPHFLFVGEIDSEDYHRLYEVIDHGIDHSQYFQGCGVSHTIYDDVATGFGCDAWEALDDALEGTALNEHTPRLKVILACVEHEYAPLRKTLEADTVHAFLVRSKQIGPDDDVPEDSELYAYVSIRYSL